MNSNCHTTNDHKQLSDKAELSENGNIFKHVELSHTYEQRLGEGIYVCCHIPSWKTKDVDRQTGDDNQYRLCWGCNTSRVYYRHDLSKC